VTDDGQQVSERDYPTSWRVGEDELLVTYQFEPGSAADGVTVHVPLALLSSLRPEPFGWQIPGLRHELVTALIRSLPKAVRRSLIPAPDRAAQVLGWIEREGITCDDGSLLDVLSKGLELQTGTRVAYDDWAADAVPDHLRITFRVVDESGRTLAEGKDLGVLQDQLRPRVQAALSQAADDLEVTGLTRWNLDQLPARRDVRQGSHTVEGYPALVDEGESVAVRVLPSAREAAAAQRGGLRRLLRLELPSSNAYVLSRLDNASKLALSKADFTSATGLLDDCTDAAVDALVAELVDPVDVRDHETYQRLRSQVKARLDESVLNVVRQVEHVLSLSYQVRSRLTGSVSLPLLPSMTDLQHQLESLVHNGFVTQASVSRLPDLQRYLQAMLVRLDKLPDDPARDRGLQAQVAMAQDEYEAALADVRPGRRPSPELLDVRWMIEELRVSLFAQTLRTAYPVSLKRIHRAILAAS
jgi:ATP-dependent helicase HrpA